MSSSAVRITRFAIPAPPDLLQAPLPFLTPPGARRMNRCSSCRQVPLSAVEDRPEIDRTLEPAAPNAHGLLWLPVAHVVPMGDDASTALELALQLRPHRKVQLGREEERHHGGVGKVCREEIFVEEPDANVDMRRTRPVPGSADAE